MSLIVLDVLLQFVQKCWVFDPLFVLHLLLTLPTFILFAYLDVPPSLGFFSFDSLRHSASQMARFSTMVSYSLMEFCDSPALFHLFPLLCHPIFQKFVEISQALMLFLHFCFCRSSIMGLYVFSTLPIIYRSLGKEGKGQKKEKKKKSVISLSWIGRTRGGFHFYKSGDYAWRI